MIYDCFLFNNELDILDIRLNVLSSVVDKFVLVESTVTHTNKPKPLYFQNNKKMFEKFKDKIIHIIIKDTPNVTLPWIINDYQFSQMKRGLINCKDNDVVIFGDLDEIPKPEKVIRWKEKKGLKVFSQSICYYYLNFVQDESGGWYGTKMISYGDLKKFKTMWIAKYSKPIFTISNGGWHFSYVGNIKRIQKKMTETVHQEFNNDKYNTPEKIKMAIIEGRDLASIGWKFHVANLDFLPEYIKNNKDKFKDLLISESELNSKRSFISTNSLKFMHLFRVIFLRKIKKFIKRFLNGKK